VEHELKLYKTEISYQVLVYVTLKEKKESAEWVNCWD